MARGPMGRGMHGGTAGESAKDFKGTIKKLFRYMGAFKVHMLVCRCFCHMRYDIQHCGTEDSGPGHNRDLQRPGQQGFRRKRHGFRQDRENPSDYAGIVCDQRAMLLHTGNHYDRSITENHLSAAKRDFRKDQPHADELF